MSNYNYKQMTVPFALAVLIVTMLLASNQGAYALPPSIPTITSPATGSTVHMNSFTVTGKTDPLVVVILSDENGNDIGTDVSGPTGFWKIDIDPLSGSSSGIAHTITARAIDSNGVVSTPSASISVTVISSIVTTVNTPGSPPPAPTISTASPTTFHESTPTIKGTGQAFATIDLFNGGTNIGETVADGAGNWAIPISPLADGTYSLTATATDSDGTSASSSAATIIIDTVSTHAATVTAPTITSPTNGQIITDNNPTITGTADPHVSVIVTDENGNELGSTLSSTTGQWSIDPPIPTGTHTISAQATDANGDTSAVTSITVIRKDSDNVLAPTIFGPEDGSTIGTTTPVISGSALSGDTILLFNNGHQITTSPSPIIADGDGNWFGSPASALSTGTHVISAKAQEGIRISAESTQITVVLAGTATPASTVKIPAFLAPFTFTASTQTISGNNADPGAVISLSDEFGNAIGDTTANSDGTWSVATQLTDGSYSVTATSSTSVGLASSNPQTITVITTGTVIPSPPVINSQTTFDTTTPEITGTSTSPGAVILLFDGGTLIDSTFSDGTTGDWSITPTLPGGSHSLTAKAQNGAGTSAASSAVSVSIITQPNTPSITGPTATQTTDTPTITGSADNNVAITLYDEFGIVGTGVSNSGTGAWSIVTSSLGNGPHTLTATATNTVGTSASSAGFAITIMISGAPGAVTITSGTSFITATPTITGTSDAGATIHVTDALGNLLATTTADGTGTWSVAPTSALSNGLHTIIASAVGSTETTSSAPQDIIIDVSTAPNVPDITTAGGDIFNTSTQTITGLADVGVTVTVYDGLISLGSTTSDGVTGEWSLSTTLSDGSHTLTAQASNSNGASALSGGVDITVASTSGLPTIPSITTGELSSFGVANPTIKGTADTSTTSVTALDENGNTIGTTSTFDSAGNWAITTTTALSAGQHTIFAKATNGVGTSVKSTGVDIIVNLTGPPPVPILNTPTGFVFSASTQYIIGLSDPGATITVLDGGTALTGGTLLGPDPVTGLWVFTPSSPLTSGDTITATASNSNGASAASSAVTITIPATPVTPSSPPSAATKFSPADGSIIVDVTPTITGTADAGALIELLDNSVTPPVLVGADVADASGSWSITTAQLDPGTHTITVRAINSVGQTDTTLTLTR